MFISYKGRNVELGKPAQVYFNLKERFGASNKMAR
jgi:hypothetical protein